MGRGPLWTAEADAKLLQMRDVDRLTWSDIDGHFRREHGSSSQRYKKLRQGTVRQPPSLPKKAEGLRRPRWTEAEMAIAQARWREMFMDVYGEHASPSQRQLIFDIIGRELKRTPTAIEWRMRDFGASFGLNPESKPLAAPVEISQAMIEREARRAAENRRSVTATFFGDPPPGYSALDQRRQSCTGAPRDSR